MGKIHSAKNEDYELFSCGHYYKTSSWLHTIVWVTNWVWVMLYIQIVENIWVQIKQKPWVMLLTFFNEFHVIKKSIFQFSLVFSFYAYYLFAPIFNLCFSLMYFKKIKVLLLYKHFFLYLFKSMVSICF